MTASQVIQLPVKWKNEKFKLNLNVIDENVPFLIGIEAISKMGLILDMSRMKLSMGVVSENICQSDSGHIIWESLTLDPEASVRDLDVFLVSEKEQRDTLKKLHIKLGHASEEKMTTAEKYN